MGLFFGVWCVIIIFWRRHYCSWVIRTSVHGDVHEWFESSQRSRLRFGISRGTPNLTTNLPFHPLKLKS